MKYIKTHVEHIFKPNDTINSVLRYYNNDSVEPELMKILIEQFRALNGNTNPSPGDKYKIPVLEKNNG